MKLAQLYQGEGTFRRKGFQQESDLDLYTLPIYACKVPSIMFFPFITYFCGSWFSSGTEFIIPYQPLNRLHGKYWLYNMAFSPPGLASLRYPESGYRLAWIEPDGSVNPENIYSHSEVSNLAFAAQSYFLDEIRYVYDEKKSVRDNRKSSKPSRHSFDENIATSVNTKEYLTWYITIFNIFFDNLLEYGKSQENDSRTNFATAGWTINRLAIDTYAIASTDAPYVRKWQFFGFVDALGNLMNHISKGKTTTKEDGKVFGVLLSLPFFYDKLRPSLEKIPIPIIRHELINNAQNIYESIDRMKSTVKTTGEEITISGQDLLRAYRNSRHGYAINETQRDQLIAHDGKIPDNLPDLCIALWHYLLLEFPFGS